jgi:hypothetical protein
MAALSVLAIAWAIAVPDALPCTPNRTPFTCFSYVTVHWFIIIGSQSILGQIPNPPPELKMSMEADMYPKNAPEKADLIEGALGEGSNFHDMNRYYAQGVGPETPTLPEGWQDRLHRVQTRVTDLKIGFCLDMLDLFMSKAYANREKDREFNMSLLQHGYVKLSDALDMVARMPIEESDKRTMRLRIQRWARMVQERGHDLPT